MQSGLDYSRTLILGDFWLLNLPKAPLKESLSDLDYTRTLITSLVKHWRFLGDHAIFLTVCILTVIIKSSPDDVVQWYHPCFFCRRYGVHLPVSRQEVLICSCSFIDKRVEQLCHSSLIFALFRQPTVHPAECMSNHI